MRTLLADCAPSVPSTSSGLPAGFLNSTANSSVGANNNHSSLNESPSHNSSYEMSTTTTANTSNSFDATANLLKKGGKFGEKSTFLSFFMIIFGFPVEFYIENGSFFRNFRKLHRWRNWLQRWPVKNGSRVRTPVRPQFFVVPKWEFVVFYSTESHIFQAKLSWWPNFLDF